MELERNKRIYQERKDGTTLKTLADKYKLSIGRVRVVFHDMERLEGLESNPLYQLVGNKNYLRALHRININTVEDLSRYASSGGRVPRGIGRDAYIEICKKL